MRQNYGRAIPIIGLVLGCVVASFGMLAGILAPNTPYSGAFSSAGMGMFLGVGAIVAFPLFYGVIGFVFTFLAAAIYNLLAGFVGGIEIQVEPARPSIPYMASPAPLT